MQPFEVIVYDKDFVLLQRTVIAPSEYTAVLKAYQEVPFTTPAKWEDITVLVRPFGKK